MPVVHFTHSEVGQTMTGTSGRSTFGELLREFRTSRGMKQATLARIADFSSTYISQLENGKRHVASGRKVVVSLGQALGLTEVDFNRCWRQRASSRCDTVNLVLRCRSCRAHWRLLQGPNESCSSA